MANETTFSIKFEGYDKTFDNIENVVEELVNLQEQIQETEKELSKSKFGTEQFDNLQKELVESEKLLKGFTEEVAKSSAISNKALQSTIQLQKEAAVQSEEIAKAFDEAFSPEAIIEFSAKAGIIFKSPITS